MATLKSAEKKGLALPRRAKPTVITPFQPTLPDVNLLPPRVFEMVKAKQAQRKLSLIGGVAVLAVAALYGAQAAQISVANSALDEETAKSVVLEKQARDLNPVKIFYSGVDAQKVTVKKTMERELLFSKVAAELLKNITAGVKVETMTVAAPAGATAAPATSCPAPDPFNPAPIVTCVQFTGTAAGRTEVSAFLANLNASAKFSSPYVPVTDSGDGKQVTFNGSVGITEKFFSNRYADDGYLLKGAGATP